ncbi:CbiX/SirB N-terminal domain-containing protein [Shimia sp.]|uniref:CbiX/SirB N-terminal domain-containing protein n=1 Tax=Shimia sp. TaxID=1954381 RepID=UPI003566BE23
MSGTRSHSRKAPATEALIVAHGQPSDPAPAEAALARLRDRVQAHLPELRLGSATMANGSRLEEQLATLPEGGLVYPLFMANGWFVRTALRRRIGERPLRVLPPLGLDPELPALAAGLLKAALDAGGLEAEKTQLMIAAHGSAHGHAAAEAALAFARRLDGLLPFARVSTGFVEQAPRLPDLSREINAPCLCLPFFAMDGDHMKEDVRQDMAAAGFAGEILPALGTGAGVPELIATALRNAHFEKEAA